MDSTDALAPLFTPTRNRPLLGMTVLVVEDSRFASEALRLMCLRSGARIRRADCLRSARRHLQVYRPSVAIIDLGLPDGSGADLIKELAQATPRVGVIIGISGNDHSETTAITAGADGFLAKPLDNLALFQQTILQHMPQDMRPAGLQAVSNERINPDLAAYRDDMSHAASMLDDHQDGPVLDYLTQFLSGVAQSADDNQLADAVLALSESRQNGRAAHSKLARVAGMVQDRLHRQVAI